MNRTELADRMLDRLRTESVAFRSQWESPGRIRSAVVDELLPVELAGRVHAVFPPSERMMFKNSLRERKFVSARMDTHDPLLEESLFAFQDPRIVALIGELTGIPGLVPDPELYAGGVSVMERGHFLNPHLDNSHDGRRRNYRALNLLWYVSPDWDEEWGGNLELWDRGLGKSPRTVWSRFNRLVVMQTDRHSFHSVSPVAQDGRRCCISNYFFSPRPVEGSDYFHSTSFRGRPGQGVRDLLLRADNAMRSAYLRLFPGAHWNTQTYRK